MSLVRLIYYGALIGGWAAFLGWTAAEVGVGSGGRVGVVLTCGLVGAAIGGGLSLVAGAANGQWKRQAARLAPGLLLGGLGGAIGGLVGDLLYSWLGLPRALGWMIMGAGIGVVDGLYDRSPTKVRNGLIGGLAGGLAGGLLFDPILGAIRSDSGMTSRAVAFVILGMCIGMLISAVQVVLKEAWLTVLDGFRPGRQLILSQPTTVLGRAEHVALPFIANGDRDLEPEHLAIIRLPSGGYELEDRGGRLGTSVNGARVQGRYRLKDGDVIQFGNNSVRFGERHRKAGAAHAPAVRVGAAPPTAPPARPVAPPPAPRPSPAQPPPRPAPPPTAPAPAAQASARPAPPPPAAAPAARPTATAQPAAVGAVTCPSCGMAVAKGQRYCMRCDLSF